MANLALDGTPTKNITAGAEITGSDINDVNDDNMSTFFGVSGFGGPAIVSYIVEIDLGGSFDVTSTEVDHDWTQDSGVQLDGIVDLFYDSAWNTVDTFSKTSTSGSANDTATGSWTDVTKARVTMTQIGFLANAQSKIYEFRVFGAAGGEDKGLRIRGKGSTIVIASSDNSDDFALKYYDGTVIKGIPLVDTDDANASPIRIYDGTTIKALAKIT